MVDPLAVLRQWILATPSITSLLGTNIGSSVYVGDLPETFNASLGPGIQINAHGGVPSSEIPQEIRQRIQLKVWANSSQWIMAHQVYAACFDLIHGANMVNFGSQGIILAAQAQDLPQDIGDPDTGWASVMGYFELYMVTQN